MYIYIDIHIYIYILYYMENMYGMNKECTHIYIYIYTYIYEYIYIFIYIYWIYKEYIGDMRGIYNGCTKNIYRL